MPDLWEISLIRATDLQEGDVFRWEERGAYSKPNEWNEVTRRQEIDWNGYHEIEIAYVTRTAYHSYGARFMPRIELVELQRRIVR